MTGGSIAPARRSDRRFERSRDALEALLDTVFRPRGWAAALAYRLGLQGRLRTSIERVDAPAGRSAPMPSTAEPNPMRPPLRVAFASDFHAGPTTYPKLLSDACCALAELRPDVLLLGGDFVSVRASSLGGLVRSLAEIPAPLGKFAVLGNHDLRANAALLVPHLEEAGVRVLTNRHVPLPPPFNDVLICGLDDATRGEPRADLSLDLAGDRGIRIVLMHSPDGLEAIGDRHFDLALCGHTHGGQIAWPWGRPVIVPGGRLNRRYCSGRFELAGGGGTRTIIVSRGVGCSTLPVRLFAAPEVHLCLIV
jgi:predicted MPP superfamily phosphohydrolase